MTWTPAEGGGGGGLEKWGSVSGPLFCVTTDVGAEGAGTQNFGPKIFFPPIIPPPPHLSSQDDQCDVGIILSHRCWADPPPPARQVRHPRPEPPLPSRRPRRGGGLGKWASVSPPPPAEQFSSRQGPPSDIPGPKSRRWGGVPHRRFGMTAWTPPAQRPNPLLRGALPRTIAEHTTGGTLLVKHQTPAGQLPTGHWPSRLPSGGGGGGMSPLVYCSRLRRAAPIDRSPPAALRLGPSPSVGGGTHRPHTPPAPSLPPPRPISPSLLPPSLSLGRLCHRSPRTVPVSLPRAGSTRRRATAGLTAGGSHPPGHHRWNKGATPPPPPRAAGFVS